MRLIDYLVLVGTLLGIAAYGMWRTRGKRNLSAYLKGDRTMGWGAVGLSVMATQASAITFISTPGQGYESGLGFVQNYFGLPLAMIFICIVFLPIYRHLNVYTAYEYLGRRFDAKTRRLGVASFLLQRGIGAGITIYAPAIVLSSVLKWPLNVTIILCGLLVIVYTVTGGSECVSVTQRYQMAIIFAGMISAFVILLLKLPKELSFTDALTVAGGFDKMRAVDFSTDIKKRYTLWSGVLGGLFLSLSYFGTDQSQVQRYIGGASLRESRLGLLFNAVLKIPMQFFILLLGALLFVFYQFECPPVFFNQAAWQYQLEHGNREQLQNLEQKFNTLHTQKQEKIRTWLEARHAHDSEAANRARAEAVAVQNLSETVRAETKSIITADKTHKSGNEADYIFITFVLRHLPNGLIGLLVAVILAAAMSSKASELTALASTTTVDLYREAFKPNAADAHYVAASKWFTVMWGFVALGFALFANLLENLIQAVNILGSLFYGVVLGLFVVAFFLKWVRGTAVFWGALAAQILVLLLYRQLNDQISYLWFNPIGCGLCVLLSLALQFLIDPLSRSPEARATS